MQMFLRLRQNNNKTQELYFIRSAKGNIFELVNVEAGVTYDVRARSISSFGVHSPYATATHTVAGKGTTAPSSVSDFTLDYLGTNALLTWTPVTDQDLSHYVIRHQGVTSGGDFSSGITLAEEGVKAS